MRGELINELIDRFLSWMFHVEDVSRRLRISHISREDGLVLASLSYYIALMGGRVFIDAGAGAGYSTSWILYGVLKTISREKIFLYAIERDLHRYSYLKENIEKLKELLFKETSQVEVNALNMDAIEFLENAEFKIDMIFVDIDKRQYIDVLKLLPKKLSEIGIGIFHNAIEPGLDNRAKEFLEKQDQLIHHVIPTRLGLLIVKKTT